MLLLSAFSMLESELYDKGLGSRYSLLEVYAQIKFDPSTRAENGIEGSDGASGCFFII